MELRNWSIGSPPAKVVPLSAAGLAAADVGSVVMVAALIVANGLGRLKRGVPNAPAASPQQANYGIAGRPLDVLGRQSGASAPDLQHFQRFAPRFFPICA